jgi:hypothetical protein
MRHQTRGTLALAVHKRPGAIHVGLGSDLSTASSEPFPSVSAWRTFQLSPFPFNGACDGLALPGPHVVVRSIVAIRASVTSGHHGDKTFPWIPLWRRMILAVALDGLDLFPPQVGVVSVTLALIALTAERLQVVHRIATTSGAGQDVIHL